MKKIYEFELIKKLEVDEPQETVNEAGEKVVIYKKVTKETPLKYCLIKPGREMLDQANLFYGEVLAEGVRAGLLTIPQLEKRYSNDGGIFSDPAKKKYEDLYSELSLLLIEQNKLSTQESEDTEEQKKRLEEIKSRVGGIERELHEYEMYKSGLFENTAEVRAKNKTLTWYILYLSYKIENDKFIPLFDGKTLKEKLQKFDELSESEDEFDKKLIKKLSYYVSFWSSGQAKKPEDYAIFEKFVDEQLKVEQNR